MFSNWKFNLFYKEREHSEVFRTFGLLIITLEGIFSFSALFVRNNPAMVRFTQVVTQPFFILVYRFHCCHRLFNSIIFRLQRLSHDSMGPRFLIKHNGCGHHWAVDLCSIRCNEHFCRDDAHCAFCYRRLIWD